MGPRCDSSRRGLVLFAGGVWVVSGAVCLSRARARVRARVAGAGRGRGPGSRQRCGDDRGCV